MKYKSLFVFFFGIVISMIATQKGFCWSPIAKSPEIHGQVVDVTTKKPIENALVTVVYYKEVPAVVDRRSEVFASYEYITDKEGKFTVPAKTSIHMPPLLIVGSWFAGRNVMVYHPLYITAPEITSDLEKSEIKVTSNKDGSLKYEVGMVSLEKRYRVDQNSKSFINKTLKPLDFYSAIEVNDNAFYWNTLTQHKVSYNIGSIFDCWRKIAEQFPSGAAHSYLDNLEKKIRDNLRSK
ncbi:MAG: hypothetical protein PHD29_09540 [bacterium]|nr:hypothetical protein [bacterium]MDD5354037.1 hypothetical protein [bacterium]